MLVGHSQYVQKLMAAGKVGDSWMVIAANAHPIFTKPDSCWNRRATVIFLREIGKLVPQVPYPKKGEKL